MTKFKKPADVTIKMDGDTVSLSRGVLNYQELNLDQKESNPLLINSLKRFEKDKIIDVKDQDVVTDLSTLAEMGYIQYATNKVANNKIMFIVDENELLYYRLNLPDSITIISADEVATTDSFKELSNINDLKTRLHLIKDLSNQFGLTRYDHIFWIDTYYHANRIRVFNKIMKSINKPVTFSISDYSLIFVTTVRHGETGCFECLENQIRTKLNNVSLLDKDYDYKDDFIRQDEKALKFGFTSAVLESIKIQGNTNTFGNVIEFDNQTMEYYFDSNRIQTSCPVCATQNNVFHEEQNLKTIEILNSLEG